MTNTALEPVASVQRQKRRRHKYHRHDAGLLRSDERRNLPHPYDLRLTGYESLSGHLLPLLLILVFPLTHMRFGDFSRFSSKEFSA